MDFAYDSIEHAVKSFDAVAQARINQIDKMMDDKIDKIQELLNGFKMTNVTSFEAPVVKKAEPINQ